MRSEFEYLRPTDIDEAIRMQQAHGDGAVFWAGGTDLVLQWKSGKTRPTHCVDLTWLDGLSDVSKRDGSFDIGALVTLSDLTEIADQEPWLRCLANTAQLMCTVQTRTIATIGGNLCNASPAADLAAPLAAMHATARVQGPDGERVLPIDDLAAGPGKTSLGPSEILLGVTLPIPDTPHAASYRRIDRTVVDIALVSASSAITLDGGGKVSAARIALGAVAPTVIVAPDASDMLMGLTLGQLDSDIFDKVGEAAAELATPISDVRASAEYRSAMVRVLVARTLEDIRRSLVEQTS